MSDHNKSKTTLVKGIKECLSYTGSNCGHIRVVIMITGRDFL